MKNKKHTQTTIQTTRTNKLKTFILDLKAEHFNEREDRIVRRITLDQKEYNLIDKAYILTIECLNYVNRLKIAGVKDLNAGFIQKHFGFADHLDVSERIEVLEELVEYLKIELKQMEEV